MDEDINIDEDVKIENKGYRCPLCNQTVSKTVYLKITGIWEAREKEKEKYRRKLIELKTEKKRLKRQYKKDLREEIKKKTDKLDLKIRALKEKEKENERKAKEKISGIEQKYKLKERENAKRIKTRVTKKLNVLHSIELKRLGKKTKELAKAKFDKEKQKIEQKMNGKIVKLERTKTSLSNQLSSQGKTIIGLQNQNANLQEQLRKETTPQIEGLLYEDKLLKALKERYKNHKFKHTGKGGDILQFVINKSQQIGIIVYECKRVKHFYKKHIKQASDAKLKRSADYAILVTNATKRNYKGFSIEKGVIIVHPAGLFCLVDLLINQLIVISDFKLTKKQREEAIQKTLDFIQSPEFTNKIEAIMQESIQLYESLVKEIGIHKKTWFERYRSYKKIYEQTDLIKEKTRIVLPVKVKEKRVKNKYPSLQDST